MGFFPTFYSVINVDPLVRENSFHQTIYIFFCFVYIGVQKSCDSSSIVLVSHSMNSSGKSLIFIDLIINVYDIFSGWLLFFSGIVKWLAIDNFSQVNGCKFLSKSFHSPSIHCHLSLNLQQQQMKRKNTDERERKKKRNIEKRFSIINSYASFIA